MKLFLLGTLKLFIFNRALQSVVLRIVVNALYDVAKDTHSTFDDEAIQLIEDNLIKLGYMKK